MAAVGRGGLRWAAAAARTSRIRIGSGSGSGMLPHDAALKLAEQFRALDAVGSGCWGSCIEGALLAAYLGLPWAFADFFMDGQGVEEALALYRRHQRHQRNERQ